MRMILLLELALALVLVFNCTTGIFGQDIKEEETVRVIIGFPDALQQAKFEAAAESDQSFGFQNGSFGFQNWVRYNRTNAVALTLPVSQLPSLLLQRTRSSSGLSYIQEETIRKIYVETIPYGISAVQGDLQGIPLASVASDDVDCFRVCVIDSGLMVEHPDIPFVKDGTNILGKEFGIGRNEVWYNPSPDNDHGTHVTGTIIAKGGNDQGVVGIIPNNQGICLLVAKVFDANGEQSSSFIAQAAEWCADNGARVINMSFGGTAPSRAEANLFEMLWEEGILVVAAAGNGGNSDKSYPASYPNVISVAAVDESNRRASFSQFNDQVDLSAPGVNVLSTAGGNQISITAGNNNVVAGGLMGLSRLPGDDLRDLELVDCELAFEICLNADNKVCLIERGESFFWEKALSCQDGKGVAALIYNNGDGRFTGTLGNNGVSIPVVTISRQDGLALLGADTTVSLSSFLFGYSSSGGTSMASPHVAGVAAKIWAARPECTNAQVREALFNTALDLGDEGRDNEYGFGLVQAVDAYNYLLSTFEEPCGVPPPTFTATPPTFLPATPPRTQPTDDTSPFFPQSTCKARGSCASSSECCSNLCRVSSLVGGQALCREKTNLGGTGGGGGASSGGQHRRRRLLCPLLCWLSMTLVQI